MTEEINKGKKQLRKNLEKYQYYTATLMHTLKFEKFQ